MDIVEIIALIIGAFYVFVRAKNELHMMQLNSYMNHRYLRWLLTKNIRDFSFIIDLAVVALFIALSITRLGYLVIILSIIYFGFSSAKLILKKEKKKLVFTPRAIRLFIFFIIVFIITGYFIQSIYALNILFYFYLPLTPIIIIILFLFANIIAFPFEEIINRFYIIDAKKKLRQFPSLLKIGVTGSYGKTSTKYFLKNILSETYNTLATPESYNTTMGVVKTIRMNLKPMHEVFVAEMGAKKRYDIKELCEIVTPKYGIITAVGEQHLETFGSIENILKTKFELHEKLQTGGVLLVNKDYPIVQSVNMRKDIKIYYYSINDPSADFNIRNMVYSSKGMNFEVYEKNSFLMKLETKLVGKYNVSNILAAATLAYLLKVPKDDIRFSVKRLESVPHRMEIKTNPFGVTIIDDAFNSNPFGAEMALEVLENMQGNKKIIITPGMVELGSRETELNFKFGQKIARICNLVILVGPNQTKAVKDGLASMKYDSEKIVVINSIDESKLVLQNNIAKGDIILYENDLPDTYKN